MFDLLSGTQRVGHDWATELNWTEHPIQWRRWRRRASRGPGNMQHQETCQPFQRGEWWCGIGPGRKHSVLTGFCMDVNLKDTLCGMDNQGWSQSPGQAMHWRIFWEKGTVSILFTYIDTNFLLSFQLGVSIGRVVFSEVGWEYLEWKLYWIGNFSAFKLYVFDNYLLDYNFSVDYRWLFWAKSKHDLFNQIAFKK